MSSSHEFEEKNQKSGGDARRQDDPLDPSLRHKVRKALGREVGPVRLHTGPDAAAEADRQGARAVARDQDIYFSRDTGLPEKDPGSRLVIHELVHTIQQSDSSRPAAGERELEAEADTVADAVIRGERSRVALQAQRGAFQRQAKGKPEPPAITRHADEITPVPPQGTIAAAGASIAYLYATSSGARYVTLTLRVPEGAALIVSPLTDLREGETYRVQNDGGTGARAVVVSVDKNLRTIPKIQATLSRGSASHVVVFQFPGGGSK